VKTTLIITAILFIYGAFSTFFRDTALAGNIGKLVGDTNIYLFGYFAYVNILLLFYPLYKLYTDAKVRTNIDFYLGWILFFIAAALLEALMVDAAHAGFIGTQVVSFLQPYIGKAGLWLFWMMIVALAAVFIVDEDFEWRSLIPERNTRPAKQKKAERKRSEGTTVFMQSVKKGLKRLFTNPFASPKLEEEMMPAMETVPQKEVAKPARRAKKSSPKRTAQKPLEPKVELVTETVLSELEPDDLPPFDLEENEAPVVTSKSGVEIVKELEENSRLMQELDKGKTEKPKNFKLPKLDFLQKAPKQKKRVNEAEIDRKSGNLLEKLKLFNINGDVVRTYSGPLVTTFEFKPAPNVKVSKILGLQDDLAMALSAETIRIQAPIPGRDVVGIEIPNEHSDIIYLREILESELFQNSKSPLTIALGKDIVGKPFITDIKKLPHLLIAGTTGSGKSVGINAMILSLLYKNDPDHLKLMMIDPKMLEFSIYDDIPHLITPVITEPKKAIAALANMVAEMERRYKLMAEKRTKNIDNYNEKVRKDGTAEPMPFIVVIIDELADLMMNGGKEVETSIARLAQKSRACGIHLIVATQRPSVDVVTGIIKANLPSRLSYRVGQKIDSKVILDSTGADSLLGRGDGLFTPPGTTGLVRIHAPWATEEEIEEIVEYIKAQRVPDYDESYLIEGGGAALEGGEKEIDLDPLYEEAKAVVLSDKKTSISYLQRKLQIGYNRSANIIEQLEATGVLSVPNAKGNREILL
jgi:S-DNA-T family DNA segregation ATPase FtsK/SpoIIIE